MTHKNQALKKRLDIQNNDSSDDKKYGNLKIVKIEEEKDSFVKTINGNRLSKKWSPDQGDYQADIPIGEEYDPRKEKKKKSMIYLGIAFFIVVAVTLTISYMLSIN